MVVEVAADVFERKRIVTSKHRGNLIRFVKDVFRLVVRTFRSHFAGVEKHIKRRTIPHNRSPVAPEYLATHGGNSYAARTLLAVPVFIFMRMNHLHLPQTDHKHGKQEKRKQCQNTDANHKRIYQKVGTTVSLHYTPLFSACTSPNCGDRSSADDKNDEQ